MAAEIYLPGWLRHTAKVITHDEHHMSAFTVEIQLPFKVGDSDRLFTTNGAAFLSELGPTLYIYDATVVLKVDCKTRKVQHYVPPKPCYIRSVQEYENGLGFQFFGCDQRSRFYSNDELRFLAGTGPVKNGLFPSAHEPSVRRIWRGT